MGEERKSENGPERAGGKTLVSVENRQGRLLLEEK